MRGSKSSVSKAESYGAIGEFWDTHDSSEYVRDTDSVQFEVDISSELTYYPIDSALARRVDAEARAQGVRAADLIRRWVEEKVGEPAAPH